MRAAVAGTRMVSGAGTGRDAPGRAGAGSALPSPPLPSPALVAGREGAAERRYRAGRAWRRADRGSAVAAAAATLKVAAAAAAAAGGRARCPSRRRRAGDPLRPPG